MLGISLRWVSLLWVSLLRIGILWGSWTTLRGKCLLIVMMRDPGGHRRASIVVHGVILVRHKPGNERNREKGGNTNEDHTEIIKHIHVKHTAILNIIGKHIKKYHMNMHNWAYVELNVRFKKIHIFRKL
jgi:hypothetical protein